MQSGKHLKSQRVQSLAEGENRGAAGERAQTGRGLATGCQVVPTRQHIQDQRIEALAAVAGGLAHDFKNILQPILINAELVADEIPAGSPEREYLDQIIEAAQRGKDLVRKINEFGQHGKIPLEPVDVQPIVCDALNFLRSSLRPDITLRQWFRNQPCRAQIDPAQLYQLTLNLCLNAVQAIPSGRGFLGVSLKQREIMDNTPAIIADIKPGTYIQLTVRDTGSGIAPEIRDRIFDPFFTTRQPGKQSGLGLAIVYAVVKDVQGSLIVESVVGRGSCFKVFFPVRHDAAREGTAETVAFTGEQGGCILLVDDDMAELNNLRQLLDHLGYHCRSTTDPQEALNMVRGEPDAFALLITDQLMPRMRGHELISSIHAIRDDLPVILCSGSSAAIAELQVSRPDIKAFIHKPFTRTQLRQAMEEILR
jgi:signal transduction histidine kinase/CheY-like chemotaxis protein